jgi:hypothetical protein
MASPAKKEAAAAASSPAKSPAKPAAAASPTKSPEKAKEAIKPDDTQGSQPGMEWKMGMVRCGWLVRGEGLLRARARARFCFCARPLSSLLLPTHHVTQINPHTHKNNNNNRSPS